MGIRKELFVCVFGAAIVALAPCGIRAATVNVSVTTDGKPATGSNAAVSSDGRFVAFDSTDRRIVANDTNGEIDFREPRGADVFVRDRESCITTRVSVASGGAQANHDSFFPRISGNGQVVSFLSKATNLVSTDINIGKDAFVHDVRTNVTELVNVDSDGRQGEGLFGEGVDRIPAPISQDGRIVVFTSRSKLAPELAALPLPPCGSEECVWAHVFARDRVAGATELISKSTEGVPADQHSATAGLSRNGRIVAFTTSARLIKNDEDPTSGSRRLYLRDRISSELSIANRTVEGAGIVFPGQQVSLSEDGCVVAFEYREGSEFNLPGGIAVYDCATGGAEKVARGAFGNPPALSADGRWIAYGTSRKQADGSTLHAVAVFDRITGVEQLMPLLGEQFGRISLSGNGSVLVTDRDGVVVATGALPQVPSQCEPPVECDADDSSPADAVYCLLTRARLGSACSSASLSQSLLQRLGHIAVMLDEAASASEPKARRVLARVANQLSRGINTVRRQGSKSRLARLCAMQLEEAMTASRLRCTPS